MEVPHLLAGVFVAAVLIAVLVLIGILVAVLVLVLILVIHGQYPPCCFFCGSSATIGCPGFQDLSLGLKRMLIRSPEKTAAVIPPAEAFKPPVNIPEKPSC